MNTQTIKLQLYKSLIMEAVKNETYIKGEMDKAIDDKATKAAYQEQAGDDTYHDRKLMLTMYQALGELKGLLSGYVSANGASSGNNVSDDLKDDVDNFTITLVVSSRFNKAFTDDLAKLCSKYIIDEMTFLWWLTINQNQAQAYGAIIPTDIMAITRCFNKVAPIVPSLPYASVITTVPDVPSKDEDDKEASTSAINLVKGEEDTITYSLSRVIGKDSEGKDVLDNHVVDDIEAVSNDESIVKVSRNEDGFTVTGVDVGVADVKVYSRHDETVSKTLEVTVTKE